MKKNKSYKLKISTLTPLHIGTNAEKFWQDQIDYYYQTDIKKLFVLNTRKIIESLSTQERSEWLSKMTVGKIKEFNDKFFQKRRPEDYSDFSYEIESPPKDMIRTFIRNGLGITYIPGSSIKGAIRSSIFKYFFRKRKKDILQSIQDINKNKANVLEEKIFGGISNNLMHFLQVSDVQVSQKCLGLTHTKTYNLIDINGVWEGGWKHSNYSNGKFKQSEFVFTYECIKPDYILRNPLVIKFDSDLLEFLIEKKEVYPEFIEIFNGENPIEMLFEIINDSTLKYLNKELEFYEKFPDEDKNSEIIISTIEYLINETKSNQNECVLRLGQGSGFHSITGDWRFDNHIDTIINPDQFNRKTNVLEGTRYKSRKIVFKEEDEGIYFDLLGFLKFTLV